MTCTEPGCTGSIVDGYCDVCGSPGPAEAGPVSSAVSATAPGLAAAAAVPSRLVPGACTQPGCTGTVVDGYCDVCGTPGPPAGAEGLEGAVSVIPTASAQAPSSATRSPAASAASARSGATPLDSAEQTAVTGSSRLDSTALGSARTRGQSTVTRRVHSGSQRLRSARLGAGLTRVPPAPTTDAAKAVMVDPVVPENKRSCPSCGASVGRSRDGKPGRTEGFCPRCRNPFSFTPKLHAGDLVANQYEVAGCLAHGGLGWIYLARDRNVSNRWVVLKGLLNTGDADALAVAIAEQQFLAQVEHPLIVEIYNFVTHEGAGYIVMEYVGGVSLKQILKQRMEANSGVYDPLPVDQALAYVLEVLPAFSYLHDLGLAYCDFKPDNLIQVGDAVKLIDLGGVRRIDDNDSAIYGTVGYQAPEVASMGTTVASDIFTIGRTLLVLMMEFRGYQTTYVESLPPVESTPLFQTYDSLYRLLAKCCAPDPADRFASVDELRVQLLGVLREVVAARQPGTALTSSASLLFEAPAVVTDALAWDQLPRLRTDTSDAQYAWLATLDLPDPQERWNALERASGSSPEVHLARGWAALQLKSHDRVDSVVNEMLSADPWEWRAVWLAGLGALQRGNLRTAQSSFNAVYGQVPGELAPKLALALACEQGGAPDVAEGLYRICAGTDANYVPPAAFGLARIRAARHDVAGVVQALDLVPPTSRGYTESRRQRGQQLLQTGRDLPAMAEAMASVAQVRLDPVERAGFNAQVLGRSLELAEAQTTTGTKGGAVVMIGGYAGEPNALRDGLEATYRELARATDNEQEKIDLVDQANAVRRWTWPMTTPEPPGEPTAEPTPGPNPDPTPAAGGPVPATAGGRCPSCGSEVAVDDQFCEACGAEIAGAAAAAPEGPPPGEEAPIELSRQVAPTQELAPEPAVAAAARPCASCGGVVAPDGYCETCGVKAASERDHFAQSPARWVAGVCDRGIKHHRNEDAMALSADAEPGSRAVLVVCDGVSTSTDSDVASLAGAKAALRVLAAHRPAGLGTHESRVAALQGSLGTAATAANDAVVEASVPVSELATDSSASATFVAAVLDGSLLVTGCIGDSRAYWLPDLGEPRILTTDDSVAQVRIAAGVPREEAENGPQAHAITRWLGRDAPDVVPTCTAIDLDAPGWVLVCSDGLWNYASEPDELRDLLPTVVPDVTTAEPLALADALVAWANAQGGKDNITAALARFAADPPPTSQFLPRSAGVSGRK